MSTDKLAKIDPQEKARKTRQKKFLDACTELEEMMRRNRNDELDLVRRIGELAASGQTSEQAVYQDFKRGWEKMTGAEYDHDVRVGLGVIRRLLKRKPASVVREKMIVFFHDGFAKRQGFKITAFGQMFDTLTAKASQEGGAAEMLAQSGWFDS